ncbi:MGMT family protein [Arthrobacter sp. A5]|uniref:MGMT family protein n=1 Tax=Arthrobacter sp. A5 TaxID=576926 RepID=UPI003DA85A66
MRAEFINAVLEVVDLIPSGAVLSYGDIAVLLDDGGPRQVGSVMSHYGSSVPWWRVVRAGGQPPVCHDARALEHYRAEATALKGSGGSGDARTAGESRAEEGWRVDIGAARWQPSNDDFVLLDGIRDRLAAGKMPEARKMSEPHDEVVS